MLGKTFLATKTLKNFECIYKFQNFPFFNHLIKNLTVLVCRKSVKFLIKWLKNGNDGKETTLFYIKISIYILYFLSL